MGVRWRGDSFSRFGHDVKRLDTAVMEEAKRRMTYAAERGAAEVRKNILTRGIDPKEARVETGAMVNAVSHEMIVRGDTIIARFGWPNGGPFWLLFQEEGTQTGIEAMNAVRDAYIKIREQVESGDLTYDGYDLGR